MDSIQCILWHWPPGYQHDGLKREDECKGLKGYKQRTYCGHCSFWLEPIKKHLLCLPLSPPTIVVNVFFHTVHLPVNGNVKLYLRPSWEDVFFSTFKSPFTEKLKTVTLQPKSSNLQPEMRYPHKENPLPGWCWTKKFPIILHPHLRRRNNLNRIWLSRDITMGFVSTLLIKA